MEEVNKICTMSRPSPFDKLLMVQCLKQKGQVATATGDSANDAPTLTETNKTFHEDSRQQSSKGESRYPHLR